MFQQLEEINNQLTSFSIYINVEINKTITDIVLGTKYYEKKNVYQKKRFITTSNQFYFRQLL